MAHRPTETVYPYVPVSLVTLVIAKHGGMVSGELPPWHPILEGRPMSDVATLAFAIGLF
jgi:hypothetical protein